MKKLVGLMITLALILVACAPGGTPTPVIEPVQVAPSNNQPGTGDSTPPSTSSPLMVGEAEVQVTPGYTLTPEAIAAPLPPGATVIFLTAPEGFEDSLWQMEFEVAQYQGAHPELNGQINDAVFITGLLGILLKGIAPAFCAGYSETMYRHLVDEDAGYRLARLGGWRGSQSFINSLISGSGGAGSYEIKALVSSYTYRRALFWLGINGDDVIVIISNESKSTVIPLLAGAEGAAIVENFIIRNEMGLLSKGLIMSSKAISSLVGIGTYAIQASILVDAYKSLAQLGRCLKERFEKNPDYKAWVERHQKDTAQDNEAARFKYRDESDLLEDLRVLKNVGIVAPVVDQRESERIVTRLAMVVGAGFLIIEVVPVLVVGAPIVEVAGTSTVYFAFQFAH